MSLRLLKHKALFGIAVGTLATALIILTPRVFAVIEKSHGGVVTPTGVSSTIHGAELRYVGSQGASLTMTVNLDNSRLTTIPGQPSTFTTDLSGAVTQCGMHIVAPPQAVPNTDKKQYPITLDVGLDGSQPSTFSQAGFTIGGDGTSDLSFSPHLTLTVPPGEGEHPHSDVHEHGNHGGPDWAQNAQEIFSDKELPILIGDACQVHIYLMPATYKLTTSFDISKVGVQHQIAIKAISIDPAIDEPAGWRHNGCDGPLAKGFAFLATTFLTGNALVGAVVTVAALNYAENDFRRIGDGMIAGYIQGQSFKYAIP